MSSLKERINEDLKQALRSKAEVELSTLRLAISAIVNKEKEKRAKIAKANADLPELELEKQSRLEDAEVIEVLQSEVKKRKEAIVEFEKGQRLDLVEKEKKEWGVLQKYLPQPLSDEELRKIVEEAVQKTEGATMKDMGRIVGQIMPQVKGRAEGSRVAELIKEILV